MKYTNLAEMTRTGLMVLIVFFAMAMPTLAQNSNVRNDNNRTETTRVVDRDDDTDWGWLGLLGLLGLAGLLPKKRQAVQVQEFRDTRDNRPASGSGGTVN